MAKINLKESATLALPVTAAVWLVSYLFGLLKIGTTPLFAALTPTAVVTGTVGEKVMGFIGGVIPFEFNFGTIAITYVSAVVAIILGTFLVTQFKLPVFKKFLGFNANAGKIASVLLWGAVPVYVVLVGFKFPSFMTIIGALVHTIFVAFLAVWVANLFKLKI